jgi:glutathione S-transferase
VGKKFTAADIVWYATLSVLEQYIGKDPNYSTPLKNFLAAVAAIPGVAAYNQDTKRNPALIPKSEK